MHLRLWLGHENVLKLDKLLSFHLDAGGDLLVPFGHNFDNVGAVSLKKTHGRAGDTLSEGPVGLLVLVDHGEHDEEVVLLGHTVNVTHAGVVQQLPVSVETRLALCSIQVALIQKCGFQNSVQIIF